MNTLTYALLTYITVASTTAAAEIVISGDKTNDKLSLLRSRNLHNDVIEQQSLEVATTPTNTKQRQLEYYNYPGTNCWIDSGESPPTAAWHPTYSQGWLHGSCQLRIDCNSPGYDTELECCNTAYPDQSTGHCLSQLPEPPTLSPTDTGTLYYFLYI